METYIYKDKQGLVIQEHELDINVCTDKMTGSVASCLLDASERFSEYFFYF